MDSVEEHTECRDHMSAVDSRWSEISVFRGIGVITQAEIDADHTRSLLLREECLIGALEVYESLSPEEVRIIRDTIIEGSTYHDTLSFFARIMRHPGVDSVELEPEDDAIAPEELRDISWIECIVIIDSAYIRTEPLGTPTTDEGDLPDRESTPYRLDILTIEFDGRPIGLPEVSEHLRADTSRRYPDRYRDPDISVDISLEALSESPILTRHTGHFGEGLIDREYFELAQTTREIRHETIGDRAVVGMVGEFFYKLVFSYHPLRFPEWCPDSYPEALGLIARSHRDLISDEDTLALQTRIAQSLA